MVLSAAESSSAAAGNSVDIAVSLQTTNNRMNESLRPDCAERKRLLAALEATIKETIHAKGKPESKAAYAKWQAARKAFTRHIEKHGC